MNIKISVYDFFAYTIPGGLILFIIAYALTIFGVYPVDILLYPPSLAQSAVIIGVAYVTGLILEPVGKYWHGLFKPQNLSELALSEFTKRHPKLDVKFRAEDWTILFAYIKRQNLDVASEIDRVNATNIMLRNISFGLIILAILEFIRFAIGLELLHLILSILLIIISVIAGKESVKFARWGYLGIFENISSHALNLSELVTIKRKGKK